MTYLKYGKFGLTQLTITWQLCLTSYILMYFCHLRLPHQVQNSIDRDETKAAFINPADILCCKIRWLELGCARKLCQSTIHRIKKSSLLRSASSSFFFLDSWADHPELLRLLKMKEDFSKSLSNYSWSVQDRWKGQAMCSKFTLEGKQLKLLVHADGFWINSNLWQQDLGIAAESNMCSRGQKIK